MKKRAINVVGLVLVGALAMAALSGCSNNDPAPSSSDGAVEEDGGEENADEPDSTEESGSTAPTGSSGKDSLIVATANEATSVHTADKNAVAQNYINQLNYNGLMRTGLDLEPTYDIAESHEVLNDTQWQFKIKEGVLFHNGEEVTSADFQATFEWNKDPAYAETSQYTSVIESVEIIDDYNFIINTNGPVATLLYDLVHHSNYVVPKSLIESGHDFGQEPVGTGPYKFVKWNRGDSIDFEIFEDYFDKDNMPSIQYMSWKTIPEGASRTIGLENGELDLLIEVATTDIGRLQENPDTEVVMVPGTSHNYIMINNEWEPFDNVLLRKAMDAAIDKVSIIEVAQDGLGEVALSQTPSVFPASSSLEHVIEYDVEAARQMLEESGVDPSTFVFNIIVSDEVKRRAGEVAQANLADIGIEVTLEQMELATYLDVTTTSDFIAAIGGYTSDSMQGYIKGVHHSRAINASNKARMSNPEVDALIDQALVTFDSDERNALLYEAATLVNELHPNIPLYHRTEIRAYSSGLEGVAENLGASGGLPLERVHWK